MLHDISTVNHFFCHEPWFSWCINYGIDFCRHTSLYKSNKVLICQNLLLFGIKNLILYAYLGHWVITWIDSAYFYTICSVYSMHFRLFFSDPNLVSHLLLTVISFGCRILSSSFWQQLLNHQGLFSNHWCSTIKNKCVQNNLYTLYHSFILPSDIF